MNNQAVWPRLTLHWEVGFMKNEIKNEKLEEKNHVGYWDPIGLNLKNF